jgi:glycosyltransferase involved in cell wall biosynthesis
MRICYAVLSPTFGMHQYTADPAHRMAAAGHEVHLVTTVHAPRDRWAPAVQVHAPLETTNTGFSPQALRVQGIGRALSAICDLAPDVVHFGGPHLWNVPLLRALRARGISTVHTLHDLDPHSGAGYGTLLRPWNWLVVRWADRILVHGERYRRRLLATGVPPGKVTCTPLLHLFVGGSWVERAAELADAATYEPWALFFGRVERYKGVDTLIEACARMESVMNDGAINGAAVTRVVVAGRGDVSRLWDGPLPAGLELRNRLIEDVEATDLFRRCGLLVLPYRDATQSALVAAAYYFHKPVVVTRAGALPEYVEQGRTGYVVEPGDPTALARRLDELLGDPERLARMGAAGRAWYDAQRGAEERTLLAMYGGLAGR